MVKNTTKRDSTPIRLFYTLFTDGDREISAMAYGNQVDKCQRQLQASLHFWTFVMIRKIFLHNQ